jgi:hypothetical protein
MKNFCFACLVLLFPGGGFVQAMDYEPYTYYQNFESREMMGWSSYPPIQDAAYEAPFIYPGRIVPSEDGTVLCKMLQPEWNSPQLTGVIKRLQMRLDEKSRIRFRYYIKTTLLPAWLGIDLPLANGERIRAHFKNPPTNSWVSADFGISDILAAAGRKQENILDITALALTVRFEKSDPDMPILLGFDDFSVAGYRTVSFEFIEPAVEKLEEWDSSIALKHYFPGDTLLIKGKFPGSGADEASIRISRFDDPKKTVETLPLDRKNEFWSVKNPLILSPSKYPPGMYETEITAKRAGETVSKTMFTFMVVDEALFSGHPRLWFSSSGSDGFISRMKKPNLAPFLNQIRSDAKNGREKYSLDLPYDLNSFPKKGWLKSFEPYRTRIATIPQAAFTNALVSVIDKDPAAAEFAHKALVALCRWPSWNHPFMQDRGHHIYLYQWYTTYNLGMTYDIIHDSLSESERDIVREAFIRNALLPSYQTYVVADQCTCNESNWIPAVVGGSLIAACSILGEKSNTSSLEPWLSGCLYKLRAHMNTAFGGDSACLEGFSYSSGTMSIESDILPLIEHTLGIDLSKKMDRSYSEMFWAANHDKKEFYTFGDARMTVPSTSAFPWLIGKYHDPELAWFYNLYPPEPNFVSYNNVLYKTEDLQEKKPVLAGAHLFKKTGTVVFRSGDEKGPFILTFRCGPFGNHQHLDQGTFLFSDRDKLFVTEQEYTDYYEDPFYQSHMIQPISHNCLLVDHNPQSQRTGDHGEYAAGMKDFAQITAFVDGGELAFALGDLSPVYLGNVKKLQRGILYIQPRTALIVDRLETIQGEASLDELFHSQKITGASLKDENSFTINSGSNTLAGHVVYSTNSPALKIEPDPVKLSVFTDSPIIPLGRIAVSAETSGGKAMIATILSTDLQLKNIQESPGGTIVDLPGAKILVNNSGGEISLSDIISDGVLAVQTVKGTILLAEGKRFASNSRDFIKSDTPLTVVKSGANIRYSSANTALVQFYHDSKVKSVRLDGRLIKDWRRDEKTGMVTLKLSAGQGIIEFNNLSQ